MNKLNVTIQTLMIAVLGAYSLSGVAAEGFPKTLAGTLTVRPCSINIPAERCGYFVGETHVEIPAKLERKATQYLDQDVCAKVEAGSDNIESLELEPCAL